MNTPRPNPNDSELVKYKNDLTSPNPFPWQTVKLVSMTEPKIVNQDRFNMSPAQLVAYCARVSNKENEDNHETGERLIRYLMDNQHWSPLEMVDATVEIHVTRDIGRQILRHRSFFFQEFSQRYAKVERLVSDREARMQHDTNRQSSVDVDPQGPLNQWWITQQKLHERNSLKLYHDALDAGIAKEVARVVLPEGMAMSRMYMKGSIRSWLHYLELRKGNGTQKEHQDIANKVDAVLALALPEFFRKLESASG